MATMFDSNFTFDHPPQSPSLHSNNTSSTRDPSRSVSPCSPTSAFPPPRYSVTDLAACFANSRLRQDAQICYDSCSSYANLEDSDSGWEIPADDDSESPDFAPAGRSRTFPIPQRTYSSSRRVQRQVSTRMLCSSSHQKNIAALVSKMVDCKDQCSIVSSTESMSAGDDDEGYNSSSDAQTSASRRSSIAVAKSRLEYRRSTDVRSVGASVSKAVRLRKERKHRRLRSGESDEQ